MSDSDDTQALRERIVELERTLSAKAAFDADVLLQWRGIDLVNKCTRCNGRGVRWYGSGSTWRGGAGVSRPTRDVCDACWGSGDRTKPWTDLRRLRDEQNEREARNGVESLLQQAGVRRCQSEVLAIADVLEGFANGRYARSVLYRDGVGVAAGEIALALAKVLRNGVKNP